MSSREPSRLSLRGRLAVMLLIGLGSTLGIGFLGLHLLIRDQIYDTAWVRLEKRAEALSEYAVQHPGDEDDADTMLEFRSKSHEDYFEIRDGEGRLLARSASSGGRNLPHLRSGISGQAARYKLRLPDGHAGIAVSGSSQLPAGDPRGRLVTVVAEETEVIESLEARIHRAMVAMVMASLVAGIVATTVSIRRGLEPVDRLASSAAAIDPDGPRRDLEIGHLPRELATLGQRLSELLRRLFDSRDRERRFSRSVAHELRTPLAEVRILADVGAMHPSLDEARVALREIGSTSAELQEIVDALLALYRYESGQEPVQAEPVDLVAELRNLLAKLAPDADRRTLTIDYNAPHERWVMTDAALLRRLLANLIGNAVTHAQAGSTIQVSLAAEGPLRVNNAAPHLRPSDMERLGERFFRVDSGNDHGHAGLGLPLATAIAAVSRLQLQLQLDRDQRLCATLDGFRGLPQPGTASATAA